MASKSRPVVRTGVAELLAAFIESKPLLARTIGRIAKPYDVEDIVQETFVRSYEAAKDREISHPRAFMLKTATNLALNHVTTARERLTRQLEDLVDPDVYLATPDLESEFESRERFLCFCRAVRELPVQCRRVFLLKKVYGLTQQEIADYLNISQSTVEKHIAMGLLLCSRKLSSMGYVAGKCESTDSRPRKKAQ